MTSSSALSSADYQSRTHRATIKTYSQARRTAGPFPTLHLLGTVSRCDRLRSYNSPTFHESINDQRSREVALGRSALLAPTTHAESLPDRAYLDRQPFGLLCVGMRSVVFTHRSQGEGKIHS
jgi:hypothetical protein